MLLLWILGGLLLLPGILFFLKTYFPKGNLLHEGSSLPFYLFRVWQTPIDRMQVSKHHFGPHRKQYLLLCQPLSDAKRLQEVVVYYHGGAWMFGSPEQFRMNAQFFVDLGYTVFLPSFRRPPFHHYRSIDEDLSAALQKIRTLQAGIGLEKSRILLSGMSAGGNLAALLLYDRQRLQSLGFSQELFSGILLFGAPLALRQMSFSLPLYWFAGARHEPNFDRANPIYHLSDQEKTPICWIHGTRDGLVPFRASYPFIEQLQKVQNSDIDQKILEGGTHLDSGSWVFEENEVRAFLKHWLSHRNRNF